MKKRKKTPATQETPDRPRQEASAKGDEETPSASPTPESERAEAPAKDPIETLRAECEALKDKWLRAQAECANVSKRLRQQHAEALKHAGMDLARSMLPVLDSLERTLASIEESARDDPVAHGVKLIADEFLEALRSHGVEPIDAMGQPFDPTLHEAIRQDHESDLRPGMVSQEYQRGYRMGDRILRPAQVAVAAEPREEEETEQAAANE